VKRAKTVAVMQPYFFPYLGYFRLFAAVDEFIILDTVQFPKMGRVHRSQVPGPNGPPEWLTLPISRQPTETLIRHLLFAPHARESLDRRLARLTWISAADGANAGRVRAFLKAPLTSVVDYLEAGLRLVADILDLEVAISRASALNLDPSLRGQARVIAAVAARGASIYVNAPGGRALYSAGAFEKAGIELVFLTPYEGRFYHLLPALMAEPAQAIRRDLDATMGFACA
jgi:WbqC-like protein family